VRRARRFVFRFFLIIAALMVVLAVSYRLWMPAIGRALVHDDGPAQADIAVVLGGGDFFGNRLETAGNLVRRGYVPRVLVSGPRGPYGIFECDLAIPFAVHKGFPAEWFEPFQQTDTNTRDESRDILREMKKRGVHRVLLVTSNYHSARAMRIFLKTEQGMGGGPELRMVAAPDHFFHPDTWWRGRESQKITFLEWCKTISSALGY
jgi:uncharacterized SAM-binding protein YcdF (DUF218 family)